MLAGVPGAWWGSTGKPWVGVTEIPSYVLSDSRQGEHYCFLRAAPAVKGLSWQLSGDVGRPRKHGCYWVRHRKNYLQNLQGFC